MRKLKWSNILLYIPLIILLCITNFFIDPANIYHSGNKEMAELIVQGNKVSTSTPNFNQREFKSELIMAMPDEVECIAVGPSLVMGIRNKDVGINSFYNLGASGANINDILAQFGMIEYFGKRISKVIYCFDSYSFDGIHSNVDKQFADYTNYMKEIISHKDAVYKKTFDYDIIKTKIEQLFSLSYFQSSIDLLVNNGGREKIAIVGDGYEYTYYEEDAALHYPKSTISNDEKYVINDSENYDLEDAFTSNNVDEDNIRLFEELMDYCFERNIEVELYLCPLAPSLWDLYDHKSRPILFELENYANNYAKKHNMKITGSYNPYNVGITDAEFYDCRHPRHEVLSKYFDFKFE